MTFHLNPNTSDDLFDALTNAIITGENPDAVLYRYAIPLSEAAVWIGLIRRLNRVLVAVHPRRSYTARVRQELMGQPITMIDRVRYLPPRVQIAAGIAIAAGFVLLARRRFSLSDIDELLPDVVAEITPAS